MKTKLTLLLFFFCSSIFSDITSSSIDGDWEGWNGENIIELYDGSIWEQLEYHYSYSYSYSPEVKILNKNGNYSMLVDGEDEWVDVIKLDWIKVTETRIDGDWEGWNGENIIKLYDGSIWEQLEYHYNYSYSYSPEVKIYLDYSHPKYKFYKMKVGDDKPVGVMKLK
tara:strand:- start:370 stop:870 length:501 start_codon:yes stop_codon:yes gene_type:complete